MESLGPLLFLALATVSSTPAGVVPATGPVAALPLTRSGDLSTETSLSVFLQPAPERCVWMRVDPVQGRRELVAELPHACTGVSVAWRPDRREAVVEFPGRWEADAGRRRHVYTVSLDALPGRVTPLPLPDAGQLDLIAYDTDGRLVALFLEGWDHTSARIATTLTFEGREYEVPETPGLPLLAHAFAYERGVWRRIETVATTGEACGAPGTMRLAASHPLAPNTPRLLDPSFGHELSAEPIDGMLFERLERHERIDAESVYAWVRLATERGMVVAVEGSYEYAYLTTPVILVDDDGVYELEGMAENAILAADARGRYLLLSEAVSGARPLLYDLDGGRLLFADRQAVAATFWP